MKVAVSGNLVFDIQKDPDPTPLLVFSITNSGVSTSPVKMLILPVDSTVKASIQPVDANGNPAKIDGIPAWDSSNESIATLTNISSDGLSADIYPGSSLGQCQINVTADADLGEGIKTISGLLEVQVVAGQAVGFTISTSEITPIPR